MDVNSKPPNIPTNTTTINLADSAAISSPTTAVKERPTPERQNIQTNINLNTQVATESSPRVFLREEDITDAMLDNAFSGAARALEGSSYRLSYSVHEDTGRILVQVHDTHTNEVVREIPPESRLDIYARITEFVGLLFDQGS
jgi:flagellar protein FlaG